MTEGKLIAQFYVPNPKTAALIVRAVNAHEGMVKALERIANQLLSFEYDDTEYPDPDYEGGFDECVNVARAALALTKEPAP